MRLGFVGGGAMAEALVAGILEAGMAAPNEIRVGEPQEERRQYLEANYRVETSADNQAAVRDAEIVFLAVKPQVWEKALVPLAGSLRPGQLLISIVTGVKVAQLGRVLPAGVPVVRVVPNNPCLIRQGISALACGPGVDAAIARRAESLLAAVGETVVLPEEMLDAVTALSGSGPAYVYLFIEALVDAGVRAGLPRPVARQAAVATVRGAAEMVRVSGRHPAELKDQVTSPGGTTMAALEVMEKGALRGVVMAAVSAALERAWELGRGEEG